jgi:hypothetical protein
MSGTFNEEIMWLIPAPFGLLLTVLYVHLQLKSALAKFVDVEKLG